MGMPPGDAIRLPVLRILEDGKAHEVRDVVEEVASALGVGADARAQLTPKTRRSRFYIAVTKSVSELRQAGLLRNERPGRFSITRAGRAALAGNPGKIDRRFLMDSCPQFRRAAQSAKRGLDLRRASYDSSADTPEGDGMVALVDVLGVKGSWRSGGRAGDIHRKWERLMRYAGSLLRREKALRRLDMAAFSDTLFITVEGSDHSGLLFAFSRAVWKIIVDSIRMDVPVRGCVSCGRFLRHSKNLVTGPAVDEAAMYHCLPQWVGISAAPSANNVLTGAMPGPDHPGRGLYARYNIPLKASVEQDAWAVNWPRLCDEEDSDALENLMGVIDSRMEAAAAAGMDATLKWRNTRNFCSKVLVPSGAPA